MVEARLLLQCVLRVGAHELLHPRMPRIAGRLVRPFDPAEDHRLIRSGLDGSQKVGLLARRHIVAPALQDAQCTELHQQCVEFAFLFDEGLFACGGHGNDESIHIGHHGLLVLNKSCT